jgi:hypothetical protein
MLKFRGIRGFDQWSSFVEYRFGSPATRLQPPTWFKWLF